MLRGVQTYKATKLNRSKSSVQFRHFVNTNMVVKNQSMMKIYCI